MSLDPGNTDSEPLCDEALLAAYRAGDEIAAKVLFERYYCRVVALARSQMGYKLRKAEESADIAMSAFASVFHRGRNNRIRLDAEQSLWPLLVTVTMNKVRNHAKYLGRVKRDEYRTVPILEPEHLQTDDLSKDAIHTKELILELHRTFGPRRRAVIDGLLEGRSVAEIADHTGLAERTVYKTRQGIKEILERMLTESP